MGQGVKKVRGLRRRRREGEDKRTLHFGWPFIISGASSSLFHLYAGHQIYRKSFTPSFRPLQGRNYSLYMKKLMQNLSSFFVFVCLLWIILKKTGVLDNLNKQHYK